jgi:hypothetical protein
MNLPGNIRLRILLQAAMLILGALALSACTRADKLAIQQDIGKAEAAVTDARRNKAEVYAPLELNLSEEKLAEAREAFEQSEYENAGWLAEESLADARLAEAKAESARTQDSLEKLKESIYSLQRETERRQAP